MSEEKQKKIIGLVPKLPWTAGDLSLNQIGHLEKQRIKVYAHPIDNVDLSNGCYYVIVRDVVSTLSNEVMDYDVRGFSFDNDVSVIPKYDFAIEPDAGEVFNLIRQWRRRHNYFAKGTRYISIVQRMLEFKHGRGAPEYLGETTGGVKIHAWPNIDEKRTCANIYSFQADNGDLFGFYCNDPFVLFTDDMKRLQWDEISEEEMTMIYAYESASVTDDVIQHPATLPTQSSDVKATLADRIMAALTTVKTNTRQEAFALRGITAEVVKNMNQLNDKYTDQQTNSEEPAKVDTGAVGGFSPVPDELMMDNQMRLAQAHARYMLSWLSSEVKFRSDRVSHDPATDVTISRISSELDARPISYSVIQGAENPANYKMLANILFQHGDPNVAISGVYNEHLIAILIDRITILQTIQPCAENVRALDLLKQVAEVLRQRASTKTPEASVNQDQPSQLADETNPTVESVDIPVPFGWALKINDMSSERRVFSGNSVLTLIGDTKEGHKVFVSRGEGTNVISFLVTCDDPKIFGGFTFDPNLRVTPAYDYQTAPDSVKTIVENYWEKHRMSERAVVVAAEEQLILDMQLIGIHENEKGERYMVYYAEHAVSANAAASPGDLYVVHKETIIKRVLTETEVSGISFSSKIVFDKTFQDPELPVYAAIFQDRIRHLKHDVSDSLSKSVKIAGDLKTLLDAARRTVCRYHPTDVLTSSVSSTHGQFEGVATLQIPGFPAERMSVSVQIDPDDPAPEKSVERAMLKLMRAVLPTSKPD